MPPISPARYLLALIAATCCGLGAIWLYVFAEPLAFLPSGYPAWVVKADLMRACDTGDLVFLGDSRVQAAIVPTVMPVPAANLAIPKGSPIEMESAVRRFLSCDKKPRQVVISFGEEMFGPLTNLFWLEALRFGLVTPGDLWNLEHRATTLDDWATLNNVVTPEGLSGPVRDWLYEARFPSFFFSNLLQGQVFRRYAENKARYQEVLKARGHEDYPTAPPDDFPGPEAALPGFVTNKLKLAAFESVMARLRDADVQVSVMIMPMKAATRAAMKPGVEDAYLDYLRGVVSRFPNARLIGARAPVWPNTAFYDPLHFTPSGAMAFSTAFAACVQAAAIRPDCDLNWHGDLAAGPAGTETRRP